MRSKQVKQRRAALDRLIEDAIRDVDQEFQKPVMGLKPILTSLVFGVFFWGGIGFAVRAFL